MNSRDKIRTLYEKDKNGLAQYAVTPVRSVFLAGVDPNAVYPHECYFRAYRYATHLDRLDESGILLVHGDLRVQRVRQQPALRVVQRQAGFIAGGFDAENDHGRCISEGECAIVKHR